MLCVHTAHPLIPPLEVLRYACNHTWPERARLHLLDEQGGLGPAQQAAHVAQAGAEAALAHARAAAKALRVAIRKEWARPGRRSINVARSVPKQRWLAPRPTHCAYTAYMRSRQDQIGEAQTCTEGGWCLT